MLTTLIPSRRRAEDARVAAFVSSIRESGARHAAPEWPAAVELDDTVHVPRFVLLAAVPLAALLLSACGSSSTAPSVPVQEQPAVETLAPQPGTDELTGTDAGLIVAPAPAAAELQQLEDAAASIPAVEIPHVTEPAPVVAPVPAAVPAPAVDETPQEHMQEQLPEESLGSHRCPAPEDVVLAITDAGDYVCGQP